MQVLVEHMGTPATKAHTVGILTLEQCLQMFQGPSGEFTQERNWSRLNKAWLTRLCQEGGQYAHYYFSPVKG